MAYKPRQSGKLEFFKGEQRRVWDLEDILKVVSCNFHHIVTPFSPCKGGNKKIQFPPLYKGRVREG
jgi:hypothetical protein